MLDSGESSKFGRNKAKVKVGDRAPLSVTMLKPHSIGKGQSVRFTQLILSLLNLQPVYLLKYLDT